MLGNLLVQSEERCLGLERVQQDNEPFLSALRYPYVAISLVEQSSFLDLPLKSDSNSESNEINVQSLKSIKGKKSGINQDL